MVSSHAVERMTAEQGECLRLQETKNANRPDGKGEDNG